MVSDRFDGAGPPIAVPSTKVPSVGMILHELATNAIKYGAISSPGGTVRITWENEIGPRGRDVLVCHWRESGGPPVSEPDRRGYGTELIVGLCSHLGGTAELTYPSEGFTGLIRIPL